MNTILKRAGWLSGLSGVPNIRDFVVPEPGFYCVLCNYGHASDRLNDPDGNKISSVTINPGPGPGVIIGVDVDVDVYAIAPTFIWVSPWKVLGARYGASLTTETGSGRDPTLRAFDYVRVIEIPTARWAPYDAKYYGVKMPPEVPMTTTERADTSPIWGTPGTQKSANSNQQMDNEHDNHNRS